MLGKCRGRVEIRQWLLVSTLQCVYRKHTEFIRRVYVAYFLSTGKYLTCEDTMERNNNNT